MPIQPSRFLDASAKITAAGTAARDGDLPRHPTLHLAVVEVVDTFDTTGERCALWIAFMDAWDIRDAELFIAADLGALDRIAA